MSGKAKSWVWRIFTRYNGQNINNITVNYAFSPIYWAIQILVLVYHYKFPLFNQNNWMGGAVPLTLVSTIFYLYASTFFQPDLDQYVNRPGKKNFPFGSTILNFHYGHVLRAMSWPINRAWYWLWQPFATLFTHRGAVHWPIIGVWLRVAYLYLWYLFAVGLLRLLKVDFPEIRYFEVWLRAFFPWNPEFGTPGFMLLCFPVFIADIFHSAVDYYESHQKGTPFCAATQKRGLLIKSWIFLKRAPRAIRDHLNHFSD